ncbi:hypothetical protein G2W53_022347 [Senna tora]|uniref:BED-type domain-containing protein n=1 Tax=Senna tora TaxID=362788 RepID=A0A834TL28_9FABA|nr:hypothetical protein G2W53_022347 [Senna tora]
MPLRQEFSTERLEGVPSADIGWHFGEPVAGNRNNVKCKLCDKVIKGAITRLKQHMAHFKGQVPPCARMTTTVREGMMKFLKDEKAKKDNSKRRKEEFEVRLRDDEQDEMEDLMDEDVQMRRATQENIRSQREWEGRQRFKQRTRGGQNVYEEGGGSNARGDIDLVRSRSMKQLKSTRGLMKTLRKKLGEAVSKLIIYELNLMKEFTGGREIIRLAITPFATQFIQLQSIVKQKQALKEMFNSEKFKKSKIDRTRSISAYRNWKARSSDSDNRSLLVPLPLIPPLVLDHPPSS